MTGEKNNMPPELEALGREVVAALHLAENMRLDEERVGQITGRKKEYLWTGLSWVGAACAVLAALMIFVPAVNVVHNDGYAVQAERMVDSAAVEEAVQPEMLYASAGAANMKRAVGAGRNRMNSAVLRAPAAKAVSVTTGEEMFLFDTAVPEAADHADRTNSAISIISTEISTVRRMENIAAQNFTNPAAEPFSTFSIDSDRGSFQHACQLLREGRRLRVEDIRIEQFVNSPDYPSYPQPDRDKVLKPFLTLAEHPFRSGNYLLRAAIQGAGTGVRSGRGTEFVIILDGSGSMAIGNAAEEAEIFCEVFAAENSNVADIITLQDAFGELWRTLEHCTDMAADKNIAAILVSDLRWIPEKEARENLLTAIKKARDRGVRVNVVAFASGVKDPVATETDISREQWADALSEAGGGIYLRAADSSEAVEIMTDEMQGRFRIVADDVKIQMKFDPAVVAGYRLAGYERRMMAAEDFRNDQVRAAPLTKGGQVTALYEIILHPGADTGKLADMYVRYRETGGLGFSEESTSVNVEEKVDIASDDDFMAAAVIAEWAWGLRYGHSADNTGTDVLLRSVPGGDSGRFAEYMELIRASR